MESGKKVGSYIIEEPVGRGGMGVVYRGQHEKLHRKVAIKSISPRGTHDLRRLRHRFEREAYVQAQLDHPGVVKIYDYIVSEQAYFIVMEFVEGVSLAKLIAEHPKGLKVERALDLFEQILEAVSYAHTFVYHDEGGATHQGIVHRDLKPPNIMVTPDDRIKVTDFGIVKLVGAAATDTSKFNYGSPRYVSPEQAGGEPLDQRSDIYSLGIILYEMLTGEPPFGGHSDENEKWSRTEILSAHRERPPRPPSEMNPAIAESVERVVLRALEKKPERRFASTEEFLRVLRRARGKESGETTARIGEGSRAGVTNDTGSLGDTTDEYLQDSFHTQPISSERCRACGAEVSGADETCARCGHELSSSPATSALVGQELTVRQGRRGLKLFVAAALFALLATFVYLASRNLRRPDSNESSAKPAASTEPASTPPQIVSAAASVGLLDAGLKVDSSYDGYSVKPLNDGVTDVRQIGAMRYNLGNWVSAESPEAHWVELDFKRATRITAVYVFWGFDRGRYMPSRRVELQAPDEHGEWRTISKLESGENYDRAAFELDPLSAEKIRIVQPAQAGPTNRPFVMWLREVQAFGVVETR